MSTIETVYVYDNEGIFIMEGTAYNGIMPANSTKVKPPVEVLEPIYEIIQPSESEDSFNKVKYVAKFDTKTQSWALLENHLGKMGFIDNKFYTIKDFGELPIGFTRHIIKSKQSIVDTIKNIRKNEISQTDYLFIYDYPIEETISNQMFEDIKKYRKELRDITKQEGYPDNIIWPIDPLTGKTAIQKMEEEDSKSF